MIVNVNPATFYFDRLGDSGKAIYFALEQLLSDCAPMPYKIEIECSDAQAVADGYMALYLDKALPQMPPPSYVRFDFFDSFTDKTRLVIDCDRSDLFERFAENKEKLNAVVKLINTDLSAMLSADCQLREKITAVIKCLHDNSCYRLGSILGESPLSVLLYHSGYCTGFARTVKLLCPECVCVRGRLKRAFSSVRLVDDNFGDVPHMWNAVFDSNIRQWIFFDPTAHIRNANSAIKSELDSGFYRDSYADGKFVNPTFLDLNALSRKYVLEDNSLWC